MGKNKGTYYAVREGYKPGIYRSWDECERQVKFYPGARYKKFLTEEEARRFIEETGSHSAEMVLNRFHGRFDDRSMPGLERYFSNNGISRISETSSIDESSTNQKVPKRETLPDDGFELSQAHRSPTTEEPNLNSSAREVEVYIKVVQVIVGKPAERKAQWKLCFPNYVKDSNEHCSRGGYEDTTCQAGLKAIIRALESKPDSEADLLIHTNEEESFKRMTVSMDERQYLIANQGEERLIAKCTEEMQKCVRQPVLMYVKTDLHSSKLERSSQNYLHSSKHDEDTEWAEFEPFLSDDEELCQIYIDKGKGKSVWS